MSTTLDPCACGHAPEEHFDTRGECEVCECVQYETADPELSQ